MSERSMNMISKRKVAAILAGVGVFAVVSASAATLGGIATNDLGANSNGVAAQVENGVALSWQTAYNTTAAAYVVTGVTLTPIDPAESIGATADLSITLTGASGTVLGEYVSTDGGATWTAPATTITAHDVEGASVVINGGSFTVASTTTD